MSEFFLELFSEEIPVSLQKSLRKELLKEINKIFDDKSIKSKKNFSLSTPNRLIVVFQGLDKEVETKSEEIKGPSTSSPQQALDGFLKSKNCVVSMFGIKIHRNAQTCSQVALRSAATAERR